MRAVLVLICMILLSFIRPPLRAGSADLAPVILKVIGFAQNVTGKKVVVYVAGDAELAAALGQAKGSAVGRTVLADVRCGDGVPSEYCAVALVQDDDVAEELVAYCRKHKILSVTTDQQRMQYGVGVAVYRGIDGKNPFFVNPLAAMEEGAAWNPAFLKIAKSVIF